MRNARLCRLSGLFSLMLLMGHADAGVSSANRIHQIRLVPADRGVVVEIASEHALNFTTFRQDKPRRVIIDLAQCRLGNDKAFSRSIQGDGQLVSRITTEQLTDQRGNVSRLVIHLLREADFRVDSQGRSLAIRLVPGPEGMLVAAGIPLGPEPIAPPAAPRSSAVPPTPARVGPAARVLTEVEPLVDVQDAPRKSPVKSVGQDEEPVEDTVVASRAAPLRAQAKGPRAAIEHAPWLDVRDARTPPSAKEQEPIADVLVGKSASPRSTVIRTFVRGLGGEPSEKKPVQVAMAMPREQAPAYAKIPTTPRPFPALEPEPEPVRVAAAKSSAKDEGGEMEINLEEEEPAAAPTPAKGKKEAREEESIAPISLLPAPAKSAEAPKPAPAPAKSAEAPKPAPVPAKSAEAPKPVELAPPPPPNEEPVKMVVPALRAAPEKNALLDKEEKVEISSAVKHMTWLGFQQTRDETRVVIKTTAPVEYRLLEEGENVVVLELHNTVIPVRNNQRYLDTHFFNSAVTMIVPREIEAVGRNVRVEIQLKSKVPYKAVREENIVYVDFAKPR